MCNHRIFTAIISVFIAWTCAAYDLAVPNADGVMLYYDDLGNGKVQFTYADKYASTPGYEGSIIIPQHIVDLGFDYEVVSISPRAFAWCDALLEVDIPASVSTIGVNAFDGCFLLDNIKIAQGNPTFESDGHCVYNRQTGELAVCAPGFEGVCKVADGTLSIAPSAFAACTFLQRATVPDGIERVGDNAFYFCNYLSHIDLPASVTEIGHAAFADCLSLEEINVARGCANFTSHEGVLLCDGGVKLLQSPGAKGGSAIIPEGVNEIADEAFFRSYGITTVDIPHSVKKIGEGAFIDCNRLSSVQIPAGVSEIGTLAFAMCPSLSSIYVATTDPSSISLGEEVFADCDKDYCTLFVPKGSESSYAKAAQWGDFKDIRGYDALKEQTIVWSQYDDKVLTGSKLRLLAVSSSGLPVRYALAPSSQHLASIDGDQLTVYFEGKVTVYAYQPGNVVYEPAAPVPYTFNVAISGTEDAIVPTNAKVFGVKSAIIIKGAEPESVVRVYDLTGRQIYEGTDRMISVSSPGVYIVHVEEHGFKVATR